jgi:hypothetical protein
MCQMCYTFTCSTGATGARGGLVRCSARGGGFRVLHGVAMPCYPGSRGTAECN